MAGPHSMLPLHVEVVKRELMLQEKGVDGTIDYSVFCRCAESVLVYGSVTLRKCSKEYDFFSS